MIFYMIFEPQSNYSGLYVNNVMLRSNRSGLYYIINNGDVMQTAEVQTAAVCLCYKDKSFYWFYA